jgi:drug/metabolite transporter (DMT)-like permease
VLIPVGYVVGDLDWWPGWAAAWWLLLLALSAQVVGWLLISFSLPRLPAAVSSVLLTAQPVATVVLAMLLLSESPSSAQLFGAATILVGLVVVASGRQRLVEAPVTEAG